MSKGKGQRQTPPPFLVLLCALIAAGCAVGPRETVPRNLLENPSFEEGAVPWFSLTTPNWEGFDISDTVAAHGRHSARLDLRAAGSRNSTKIVGVIQEVSPREFPRRLAGAYRIDEWTRGTPKQYIQVVIIVFGDTHAKPFANYQIRYILGGVEKPPLRMINAKYSLDHRSELRQAQWNQFAFDLHADFQRLWGQVPSRFSKVRVLFEVRYDEKREEEQSAKARVYFDDLYLGP